VETLDTIIAFYGFLKGFAPQTSTKDREWIQAEVDPRNNNTISNEFEAASDQLSQDIEGFVLKNEEASLANHIIDVLAWVVGTTLGRWDIRIALDRTLISKALGPLSAPTAIPRGMLVSSNGLPATSGNIASEDWLRAGRDTTGLSRRNDVKQLKILDSEYPIRISWDGILVDDAGHPDDIIARIREVLAAIWAEHADDIYQEAVEVLDGGGHDLRLWFRTNFFEEHIKRYSKSRRKAPIYWCLSTPSRGYAVWLYYHRFSRDSLYKVLNDHVGPKVALEERRLTAVRAEGGANPTASQRKAIEAQEQFVAELQTFRDEIARIAPLWNPDLNDGVIINYALLWRLTPWPRSWQKECKDTWEALKRGDYDWSHLAMHLWPERVVPKCAQDRSLAIAHDLDKVFWEVTDDDKARPRGVAATELQKLIAERTSPAVKAALVTLQEAPAESEKPKKHAADKSAPTGKRGRKSKSDVVQMGMDLGEDE